LKKLRTSDPRLGTAAAEAPAPPPNAMRPLGRGDDRETGAAAAPEAAGALKIVSGAALRLRRTIARSA
jgi:hypothetical protein